MLAFHAPLMPAFYLVAAKELRDVGEKERQRVMGSLVPDPDRVRGSQRLERSLVIDAVGKLGSAVILEAAAIEAYANEAIDRLASDETVAVERGDDTVEVPQPEMVRRLRLDQKQLSSGGCRAR